MKNSRIGNKNRGFELKIIQNKLNKNKIFGGEEYFYIMVCVIDHRSWFLSYKTQRSDYKNNPFFYFYYFILIKRLFNQIRIHNSMFGKLRFNFTAPDLDSIFIPFYFGTVFYNKRVEYGVVLRTGKREYKSIEEKVTWSW